MEEEYANFAHHIDRYVGGNKLTLLSHGLEAFQSMWEAIDSARETVHLETYIFSADSIGLEFALRLSRKARSGVRARVIVDAIGCRDTPLSFLMKMRNNGVQILEYHPVAPWRQRWGWGQRDHRKILVVDGKTAFTGGMNISADHAPLEQGGNNWRDTHVRVEGPVAYELDRLFRAVWYKETGRWFTSMGHPEHVRGSSRIWVAANREFLHRFRIRRGYLKALRSAEREISIANAYFIPDRGIRRVLAAAAKKGVLVRVLVPGRSDVPSVWYAGRYRYDYLLRSGVRLFEWLGPNLHAKTAAVDETWCAVGTYNLDHRSLLHNLEVNLHILDRDFARQLSRQFNEDTAKSRELTLAAWRRRPAADKILERLFYFFRYFF